MSESLAALWAVRVDRGGRRILDLPHLSVRAGETLAILGRNGAGKSTLLKVLGLLMHPDSGEVLLHGRAVRPADRPAWRRRMAAVFQQPLLLDITVERNVGLGLRLRKRPRVEIRQRVEIWLERLGIAALRGRRARQLSGGEAQRVSLARALVLEPELLLLDEPFSALDAPTRADLIQILSDLIAAHRITTVLVTHDAREAAVLADRIAVLERGRILQIGACAEVLNAPASPEIAGLTRTRYSSRPADSHVIPFES
jgi:tungstate transport system ATP-binding protein